MSYDVILTQSLTGAFVYNIQKTISVKDIIACIFEYAVCWQGQPYDKVQACLVTLGRIFSCDQAALRTPLSVRPSVSLSVTPFSLCFCHRIITKLSGVITNDNNDVHAKGQSHRSKVKVIKVITQLSHFRTVTPVWIHIWWSNDA